ncbi:MAG TPA: dihydrofolate reductase [Candidatus Galloscillospira excrementavium]|nr:dihydrofolate reductase [Candidatus Galloscillospira excrementavium]
MNLIAAVDRNWAIGKGGDQLVYLRTDLKRFQALTTGHAVILGRKTLATFPGGRPLKNRRNLVLSRDPDFHPEGAEVFPTLEALLAAAPEDAFVIGGGSVYRALLDRCSTAYITKLDAAWPADTWLPDLDALPEWQVAEEGEELEENGVRFRYVTYRREEMA